MTKIEKVSLIYNSTPHLNFTINFHLQLMIFSSKMTHFGCSLLHFTTGVRGKLQTKEHITPHYVAFLMLTLNKNKHIWFG